MTHADPDLWPCPDRQCFEGKLYRPCPVCGGGNNPEDAYCPGCHGSGEAPVVTCPTCEGAIEMPRAFCDLWAADQRVLRNDPAWDGDNRTHPGITDYSQADYFRRRLLLRTATVAMGFLWGDQQHVALGVSRQPFVTFTGFAWGYGGEGPHGLADVLADAGFFDTTGQAMAWISGRPQDEGWVVRKAPVGATQAAHAGNGAGPLG